MLQWFEQHCPLDEVVLSDHHGKYSSRALHQGYLRFLLCNSPLPLRLDSENDDRSYRQDDGNGNDYYSCRRGSVLACVSSDVFRQRRWSGNDRFVTEEAANIVAHFSR